MKAHYRRPELGNDVGDVGIERRSPASFDDRALVYTQFRVIRCENLPPRCLAHRVGNRRSVTKEIDVEGLRSLSSDRRQFVTQVIRAEQRTGKRAAALTSELFAYTNIIYARQRWG
jgi:hypothetical protein